ncbi:MAG: hypothetical protein ACI97X_001880 [Oceanospirillaceae bacterium]|jgi:hypothetical protein
MRFSLLSLFSLLFAGQTFAQCSVNVGPDTTVCGSTYTITAIYSGQTGLDSLQITYDASQGVSGLSGSPKIYMHSAIQEVPFNIDWLYPIGNWGADDGIGEMTNIGGDTWEITIHVESYYGYPGGTNVNGLWMVFRNADGTLQGNDNNDEDIFLFTSGGNTSDFGGVTGTDILGTDGILEWTTGAFGESIAVTSSAIYGVQYTDGQGCTYYDEVGVEITTGSAVVDLGPDTAICNGGSITLDAGGGFSSYEWSTSETSQMIDVSASGDYSITVTDQNGCTGLDLIHVEVGNNSDAEYSYSPTVGLTVEFTDESTNANSIDWDLDGDGSFEQSTAAGASVQHTYPSEGVFGAVMIAHGDCGDDTVSHNVLVQDVGIEDYEKNPVKIYPNPSSDFFQIKMDGSNHKQMVVTILDQSGRKVLVERFASTSQRIDITHLSNGTYVIELRTDNNTFHQQLIKQ